MSLTFLRLITVAGGVAAIAIGAAGCGNSTSADSKVPKAAAKPRAAAPAAGGTVTGSVGEWAVNVTPDKVTAGKVTFKITNDGKLAHEFVVLKTDKPAAGLGGGTRVPEIGHVGEIGGLAPGATKSVTLDLAPGHYSLVCNLPSHYKMGMHADFTVS